ncbi:MAG TPA: DUF92 domain-containing protein [Chthonomonadaceae bacterium]|nr:DUF92 domain-containing protein [Chthonomonadaceae bacterium]
MSHSLATILTTPPLWLALLLSAAFALLSWQARWLTRSGALSTFVVGFIVFGLGGGKFTVPLLTFFLSSSLLSRVGRAHKAAAHARADKGAIRDAGQVWANGGVAVAVVLLYTYAVRHWPAYQTRALLILYLAALATVNADTWATEIGALSRRAPRLLTNWRPVAPGTSGAITGLGVLAALCAAVVIPLSALGLWRLDAAEFIAVAWAGFLGSLMDSVLGASVQAQYRDPATGEFTERRETVGRQTVRVRGVPWINNDVVNFLASIGGVLCAWALLHFGAYPFV